MKEGLIFANARAKAKEGNLLTTERLMRMTECKTLSDAMRILLEINYGGGLVPDGEDFYTLLGEEERIATSFVRETVPEGAGFECFFLRNDYHNIKVLFKAKYAGIKEYEAMLLPDGNYDFSYLKERFEQGKLDFSPFVAEACAIIDRAFETGTGSPRLIDTVLDKALYKEIDSLLSKDADKYIKEYFTVFIDATNISSYLRTLKIGAGNKFFEEGFLEGGSIPLKTFTDCNGDIAKLTKELSNNPCKDFLATVNDGDMASYETAQDNFLLGIFAVNKTDMFSVAPILAYYLAKLNEIKVIRVVLVCIKNKVPRDQMRKRVRELYA